MEEEHVGTVTHYFAQPEVGAIRLESALSVGDVVAIRGHTTDFQQEVRSMQIEHEDVEKGEPGDEIAIKVKERVREGDEVYRVEEV